MHDSSSAPIHRKRSLLACCGGVMLAFAIGVSAYAAHAAVGAHAQSNLQTASLYLSGHGLALAALAPFSVRQPARWALVAILIGTLLFAGSLIGGALAGLPTRLAPVGGITMMAGWLWWAIDALRR
ncbi:MAG: DUF423 domain-containing protein [Xanthomonadaceae bacterium]|jgi:uncharacterized membrane protein YgdD (TMEM256/DUF423 family)|nr:DUF423 domain-containing protein [Xanthomonadaceae bacterium]